MIGPLEITANVASAACILLAGRNNIHTWWTGIVGCTLFAVLFFQSNLYADVVLQVFFVVTGLVGWVQWMRGDKGDTLPITNARVKTLVLIVPVAVVATAAYGALLHYYTKAYAPFVDSAVLVFSVVAQFLLMQRKVDNWPFWILVNTIAVPLYASRELYLT
ncbi:MAG: nicotinamide mononucleotide transporter, partial [Bdellovibrionales bacterium]|nr:nicotinamide mononucleotide transporter [Massilia sp.]